MITCRFFTPPADFLSHEGLSQSTHSDKFQDSSVPLCAEDGMNKALNIGVCGFMNDQPSCHMYQPDLEIVAEAESDSNEYNVRRVRLNNVGFIAYQVTKDDEVIDTVIEHEKGSTAYDMALTKLKEVLPEGTEVHTIEAEEEEVPSYFAEVFN